MPSQKLFAESRTFFTYAPKAPSACRPDWAWVSAIQGQQLEVKSNLSPVSRMFFSTRNEKIAMVNAPTAVSVNHSARPSQGAAFTISIQTETKSTPANEAGTRYFQHMLIIWSMRMRGSVQRSHMTTKTKKGVVPEKI